MIQTTLPLRGRLAYPQICVLLVIVFSGAIPAYGQASIGIQPYGSYATSPVDSIDTANLAVHIDVPLFDHKARGVGNTNSVHLIYDSGYSDADDASMTNLGWRINLGNAGGGVGISNPSEFVPSNECPPGQSRCGNPGYYNNSYTFTFSDPTGYTHFFTNGISAPSVSCSGNPQYNECYPSNLVGVGGYANDGSGYLLVVNPGTASPTPTSVTVVSPGGEIYNGITGAYSDPNGNTAQGTPPPGNTPSWAAGSIVTTDNTYISTGIKYGAYNSNQKSNWTYRSPTIIQYLDTQGNLQSITLAYALQNISYSCGPGGLQFSTTVGLLQSVTYPDGTAYHFSYYSNGGLYTMQLPTGGTITYSGNPGTAAGCASFGLPATLTRVTPDGPTTYAQNVTSTQLGGNYPATSTTTITHPDRSSETVSFVYTAVQMVESIQIYKYETAHQWIINGAVLRSTMRCYNGATGDCTSTAITVPLSEISVMTTLDDGSSFASNQFLNAQGLTTEADEYDFGSSSLLRRTVTSYANIGNNIQNRPASVTTYNSSGNVIKQTTYGYDESSVVSAPGLPGHISVSGARGNQTSRHDWLSTTGGTLDTHFTYDEAGQVQAVQDPRTNWTSYTYDSATDNCLVTTTPPVAANGISQASFATCDPGTGLTTTTTDANAVQTTFTYNAMLQPLGSSTVDSTGTLAAATTYTYSGSSLPETITTSVKASPSPNEVSSVILDGLGRPVTSFAPSGARTDTTFDSMGRVQSASNPYLSLNEPTYGTTSYAYDGLGRMIFQCQPDNSSQASTTCSPSHSYKSWAFSGSTVTSTDEVGNQTQLWTDGLGRLVEIKEANGLGKSPSMETDYQYDLLNNLTSVTQWGGPHGSPGARTRAFVYDSMSRLQSSTNPESGTSTYTYDANGNVYSKTDARGVITNYSYDNLNRLTSKSYVTTNTSAVPTLPSSYFYDTGNGTSVKNGVGRLTYEFTGSATTPMTQRTITLYDAMGRVSLEQQCVTLAGCASTPYSFQYMYDYAGNRLYANNGVANMGIALNSTFDGAGRLSQVISTWSDPTHPATLLAPPQTGSEYGAMGLVAASFGIANSGGQPLYTEQKSYDVRSRVTGDAYLSGSGANIYSYSIPGGSGYALNGNLLSVSDTVMGTWAYSYDSLNRLHTGQASANQGTNYDPWGSLNFIWNYDSFGNNQGHAASGSGPAVTAPAPFTFTGYSLLNGTQRNGFITNQIDGYNYDAAGNQLSDPSGGLYAYNYDAEGRVASTGSGTAYLYDAEGRRVAKLSSNGQITFQYLLGLGGEQVSELDGSGNWLHTNMSGLNGVMATYDRNGLHFQFGDWLGSRRVQASGNPSVLTSGTGAVEETCSSLAFGDGLNCSGSGADATEHHFTGKERDAESGLDYFGARYYASTAGRFLSPDPSAEDYADRSNPQSLNLYAYVMNSPLTLTDPDGECATLHAGIGQGPNTKNGASLIALAQTYGANVAFPYEGQSKVLDVLDIAGSLFGANDRAAQVSSDANDSGFNDSQVGGTTFLSVGFSGGASSSLLGGGLNRTNSIFYDPGLGLGQFRGSIPTYHGGLGSHPFDPASPIVNATSAIGPSYAGSAACTHDVVCAIKSNAALANALQSAGPCVLPRIFRPHQPPQALQPYIYVPFYNFDLLESNDSSSVTTSQRDNIPPPSK